MTTMTMTMTTTDIKEIADAVIDASRSWTGIDWSTGDEYDDRPEALADLRQEVEGDARRAAVSGAEVIAHLIAGDIAAAVSAASAAASIERVYGDAPTWGPVEAMVEAMAE